GATKNNGANRSAHALSFTLTNVPFSVSGGIGSSLGKGYFDRFVPSAEASDSGASPVSILKLADETFATPIVVGEYGNRNENEDRVTVTQSPAKSSRTGLPSGHKPIYRCSAEPPPRAMRFASSLPVKA